MVTKDLDKKIYITLAVHLCIIPDILIIFFMKYTYTMKEDLLLKPLLFLILILLMLIGKYFLYYKKFELYRNAK